MNFGGHLMTGWILSHAGSSNVSERRAVTILAIAPDVDGIFILGPTHWREWHRTFGHNVFFAAAILFITLLFLKKGRRLWLLPLLSAALLSHFILDIFVTGWWSLMPLWPLSDWSILMSQVIPENVMKYYIQIGLFVFLLAVTICLIIRYRRTPLEIFGSSVDIFFQRFVSLPFRARCAFCGAHAFYQCERCGATLCGHHRRFVGLFNVLCLPQCKVNNQAKPRDSRSNR